MKDFKFIWIVAILVFSSCERLFIKEDMATTSAKENFEYLWNECNEKYAYFDLKEIDWDAVKLKYDSRIHDDMSNDSLFSVLGEMLNELNDGHTNLRSYFDVSDPLIELDGRDNYDKRVVMENYILDDWHVTSPFIHGFIADGQVGYVRLNSFRSGFKEKSLDYVIDRYEGTKGLILDLRENGGGRFESMFQLLSRFVEEKTLIAYTREKNPGTDPNSFSAEKPVFVEPSGAEKYLRKVMVLTDRGSFSVSSLFALACKALPDMTSVGDTTGGGLGWPNGGQLPNAWTYRFSMIQCLSLDKIPDYEKGVPPDVYAEFDWSNLEKDEVIEKALSEIIK